MELLEIVVSILTAGMASLVGHNFLLQREMRRLRKNLLVTAEMVALREQKEETKMKLMTERANMRMQEVSALRNRGVR